MSMLRRFWRDETAATAIEYGLIAGIIALVIIGSITKIGTGLNNKFAKLSNGLS